MLVYKNLYLVGTSHIAKESILEVERVISEERPSVVALELDKGRFQALTSKDKRRLKLQHIRLIGIKGYIFARFGEYIEKKLGKYVGVSPGSEMLKGAEVAKKNNSKIALIDQKIEITLKKFSKEITWKEKFRFVYDIIEQLIKKKNIEFDLNKVPDKELISKLLNQVRDRYPNFYKVLVTDRNKYMAKKLFILMKNFDKVVAVIGAGHEEEIIEDIKNLERDN